MTAKHLICVSEIFPTIFLYHKKIWNQLVSGNIIPVNWFLAKQFHTVCKMNKQCHNWNYNNYICTTYSICLTYWLSFPWHLNMHAMSISQGAIQLKYMCHKYFHWGQFIAIDNLLPYIWEKNLVSPPYMLSLILKL